MQNMYRTRNVIILTVIAFITNILARVINIKEVIFVSLIISLICVFIAFKTTDEHKIIRIFLLVINSAYVGIFGFVLAIISSYGKL